MTPSVSNCVTVAGYCTVVVLTVSNHTYHVASRDEPYGSRSRVWYSYQSPYHTVLYYEPTCMAPDFIRMDELVFNNTLDREDVNSNVTSVQEEIEHGQLCDFIDTNNDLWLEHRRTWLASTTRG